MANIISLHAEHKKTEEWLSMSNGGTSVFITALVLSGSRIANNQRERELIVWFAEHDQSIVGIGTVGFYISEIPWQKDNFIMEKEFVLRVIEGAFANMGWESLNYEPNEKFVFNYLKIFKKLLIDFNEKYIDETSYIKWIELINNDKCGVPKGFPKCSKHNVYLHYAGCVVCNDSPEN